MIINMNTVVWRQKLGKPECYSLIRFGFWIFHQLFGFGSVRKVVSPCLQQYPTFALCYIKMCLYNCTISVEHFMHFALCELCLRLLNLTCPICLPLSYPLAPKFDWDQSFYPFAVFCKKDFWLKMLRPPNI